jgi:Zn-finger nucleic acid-binding protein
MDDIPAELPWRRPPGPINCPKCRAPMTTVTFAGIEVDRCSSCGGLWFDLLEHEDLRVEPGAEALDTGDPEVGARFDNVGLVRCPIDHQAMVRMVDRSQPSLWFESCPLCYGVFFDAGEFTDFRDENVRNLFVRRRRQRPL